MQNHVKVYFDHFGYYGDDPFIPCELCNAKSRDIHHIIERSKFGKKTKHLQDDIKNLIALCRDCHNLAHKMNIKDILTERHNKTLTVGLL